MLSSLKRVALVSVAAAAVVAVGATTANAATTWTVKVGTTATGAGTVSGASTGSVALKDTTTGVVVTCTASTASGTLPHLGSGLSGTGLALLTASTWTSCTGAGLTFNVTHVGTWSLNGASYASPTTTGNLTGVSAKLAATNGTCTFNVTGSTDGTFNNSTQVLAVAPVTGSGHVLSVSGVSGCFGVVANGHTASFTGSYKVTAKNSAGTAGALTVTSP